MKENLTELVCILDKSGSMASLTDDTIGGFNSLIKKQKDEEGECLVTTVLFNSNIEILHNRVPLKDVKDITTKDYQAMGCTALLDAIGVSIDKIKNEHANTPKEKRPDKVLFAIITVTRMPIDVVTMPIVLTLYAISTYVCTTKFDKELEKKKQEEAEKVAKA